jgi:hypothetical protein
VRHSIDTPTPVLTVTTRMPVGGDVDAVITEATAALRETSRRLDLEVFGSPLRVDHGDASVIEVCVLVRSLPDVDPPPPVAAEMLTPGTVVDSLDVD